MMYGLDVAVLRAVTAVPGHACFGVFMGAWYGAAKKYEGLGQIRKSYLYRYAALLCPALLHGCYDFTASMNSQMYGWIFTAYIIVLFTVAFLMVRHLSRNDEWIQDSLS